MAKPLLKMNAPTLREASERLRRPAAADCGGSSRVKHHPHLGGRLGSLRM
jgi:hypothetical protein